MTVRRTKPLLPDATISPLITDNEIPPILHAPQTDRQQAGTVMFHFRLEAKAAAECYGQRKGRWIRYAELRRPATFIASVDCPAAERQRQDVSAINDLELAIEDTDTADLTMMGAALTLHHTGDLQARIQAFLAGLDLPEVDEDDEDCPRCGR